MKSSPDKHAEENFRSAFERLKVDKPKLLPAGTPVSQGNVAREAGCDRTALKRARFPSLVEEIQNYVAADTGISPESQRQKLLKKRQRNRSEKERNEIIKRQRDILAGLLNDANTQIALLTRRLADSESRYSAHQEPNGSTSIINSKPKSRPRLVDMVKQKTPKNDINCGHEP